MESILDKLIHKHKVSMAMELFSILMEKCMKGSLKMISKKEKGQKISRMELPMLDSMLLD